MIFAQIDNALQNIPTDDHQAVMYVLGLFLTALMAVIGVLWRKVDKQQEATQAKLQDCEDDRKKLWEELAQVKRALIS